MRRKPHLILLLSLLHHLAFAQEPKLILPIGHFFGVGSAFSPDGKRIVTSGLDYSAKIWEVETGRLLANLSGHTDTLFGASYSPDGKKIVTTSEDGTAKIWDANTTLLLTNLIGHTGKVYQVEFSPDGKKILTNSDNAKAKIWDAESGKLLIDLKGHSLEVWSSAFSPDGKKIITGSADSTARIWDGESGVLITILKGHKNVIRFVDFSADGKRVLTGSDDGTAKIWNAQNGDLLFDLVGKKIEAVNKNQTYYPDIVSAAQFSPDGKKVLTVYLDSSLKIWDAMTGKLLKNIKREYTYVNTASFSKNGKKFSLALASGNIEIYDTEKGFLLADLKGEATYIYTTQYSADSKRIIISTNKGPAKLFDAETGSLVASLTTKNKSQWALWGSFSPDGKKIVATSIDGVTRVWDANNGVHLWDLKKNNVRTVQPQFSTDGKKIFTASSDSSFNIWDVTTGKMLLDIKDHKNKINYITVSNNSKKILSYYIKDTIYKIWDAENGRLIVQLNFLGKKIVYARLSPFGEKIFTTSPDSTVTIWDANTGSVLLNLKGSANYKYWTDFSPDGKNIFSILHDSTVKIWDAETGRLLLNLKTHSYFFTHVFSPDGKRFLCGMNNGSIEIRDLKNGEIVREFKGHTAAIMRLEYSPDGKRFVSASQDGTAKIWDAETGILLVDLKEHNFWVETAQFSPDGKKVITKSLDYTAKVWDAETGNSLYTFIPVKEEDYLIFDKYNHYDGTEAARKQLYFTCGTEVIELEQVKDQLWVPNLAERILNGETINAAKLSDLNICNLTPVVDTIEQSALQYRFRITPRLGGLGTTFVYVNNIEVKRYTPQQLTQQKGEYQLAVDKKELQRFFVTGKENSITVKSLTAKNSISSRSVSINEKGNEKNVAAPNLYAIVVGVSDYKGEELDLKFAAKDAVDMANAIDASAKKLLNSDGKEHVFIYKVHTSAGRDRFPEKNSIKQLFTDIGSKAQPNDILLIFFAGHGVVEAEKNQFYFLTADASNATVSGALKNVGISTDELSEWIKPQLMKAQKRIMIFDACNSGQAIKEIISMEQNGKNFLASRSDEKGKQAKAIEKLNEKSGMFILSASASDQKAYELGKYNQGALTYSLLKAIKEQPDILEDRQYLNISRWFSAAEKTVGELSRETGTRQQPQVVSTSNFNIGVVDDDVRNKIILPFEKFLFTRSDFRNTELRTDNLKLRSLIDKELSNISDDNSDAPLLFNPDYEGANIYSLSCDYTITGNDVNVSAVLIKGGIEIKTKFELKGKADDLAHLSGAIVSEIRNWITKTK